MANERPSVNTQNLIDLLRVGIAQIETGGIKDPYSSPAGDKNRDGKPDSTAMGKYQFLKSYWWDTKHPINGVKQFAKGKEDRYGKVESWDDFKGNRALQEAYFTYYAENHLIPEAQKAIAKGNPLNLSLDQAAAVIHKEGFGNGAKVIRTGQLSEETATNVSDAKYLEVFGNAIKSAGFQPVKPENYIKSKVAEAESSGSRYKPTAEEKRILGNEEERKAEYIKRDKAIDKMREDGVDQGTIEAERRNLLKQVARNGDQSVFDEYIETQNAMQREKHESQTLKGYQQGEKERGQYNKKGSAERWASAIKNTVDKNDKEPFTPRESVEWGDIEAELEREREARRSQERNEGQGQRDQSSSEQTSAETPSENSDAEEEEEEGTTSEGQAFFERKRGLLDATPEKMNYDKSQFSRDIPVDAITGLALGLIGNEQAKNANIPLRTEEVSEAVRQYTQEIKEKSQQGLPIEVEAAMKNQLAEAYQGGLRSIVNASGGNRATVLGNQSSLEVSRNRGLVDMTLADYEAKEKAFAQYGKALQYENDFNTRREIANHSIRFQDAQRRRDEGQALATAGFAQLKDEIQYQRENGPGSANHMKKSAMMQNLFGFDPNMKDDGSGTVPGTKSYFQAQKQKTADYTEQLGGYESVYYGLNEEQRAEADKFYSQNPDEGAWFNYLDKVKGSSAGPQEGGSTIGTDRDTRYSSDYQRPPSVLDRKDDYTPPDASPITNGLGDWSSSSLSPEPNPATSANARMQEKGTGYATGLAGTLQASLEELDDTISQQETGGLASAGL